MSRRDPRPVRNLAAWGYESDSSGDRVEVDVWTVNRREAPDDGPDASDFGGNVAEVLAWAGDVAKVAYTGAAGTGYRRISTDSKVAQQAFAGAARAAGGDRTEGGTFREGAEPAVYGPDFEQVREHGEREVLPVIRREFGRFGRQVGREPSRDEKEEEVETRPFDGFRNVIRVFTNRRTFRYHVRNGQLVRA